MLVDRGALLGIRTSRTGHQWESRLEGTNGLLRESTQSLVSAACGKQKVGLSVPAVVPHPSFPSLPRPCMDGHVMPSLALLISHSMIVLAFNDTLAFQGPIGNHMPTNCTVSIQMKIESFLLSQLVSGPRCLSSRPSHSLGNGIIRWASKCKPGPVGLPFMNPLVSLPM